MKTSFVSSVFRLSTVATVLGLLPSLTSAADAPAPDQASQLLAVHGTLPLQSAGRHVAPGTLRVQVAAKLGRPDLQLADGSWLYHHQRVNDSEARGTLVVRFEAGRVTSLSLATPAVVAQLRANPNPIAPRELLATK